MRKGPLKEGGTEAIDSVGTLRTCLKIYFYSWFAWGQAKFNLGDFDGWLGIVGRLIFVGNHG